MERRRCACGVAAVIAVIALALAFAAPVTQGTIVTTNQTSSFQWRVLNRVQLVQSSSEDWKRQGDSGCKFTHQIDINYVT